MSSTTKTIGLTKILVPSSDLAQKLINTYVKQAKDEKEINRLRLAQKLCAVWIEEKIPFPPPAILQRNDFWYLAQILALEKHIHADGKPYRINWSYQEEIWIEDFPEENYKQLVKTEKSASSIILKTLYVCAKKQKINSFRHLQPSRFLSRKDIDQLLYTCGKNILLALGFNPQTHKLILIPFDIYLRLSSTIKLGASILHTHFDGYRLRSDNKRNAFFGGNVLLGGAGFIDSFWPELLNQSTVARFIIIRKDYGY